MIRKLLLGVPIAVVAALALLLVAGIGGSAQPTEATVAAIGSTTVKIGVDTYTQLQIDAEDNNICLPLCNNNDLNVTASAGDFIPFDPTAGPFNFLGCYDQLITPCETFLYTNIASSNGFGDLGPTDNGCDSLFGPGDTNVWIYNTNGNGCGTAPDLNLTHIEMWWQAPPGFLGGNVTFCAHQAPGSVKCFTETVVGPVASLTLVAQRQESEIATACQATPVFVIASVEYTENVHKTFDNDNAELCAVARDSNGTMVSGADLIWTTTKGCLGSPTTMTDADVRDYDNDLTACSSAHSGDIATVTVTNGSATASTTVQFGGDPASCTLVASNLALNIGDTSHLTVTFLDAMGHWVPDGIKIDWTQVNSGDGSANAALTNESSDTVKGMGSADVISAIAGLATVAATVETVAGASPVCADELVFSGNIHTVPIVCLDPVTGLPNPSGIMNGFVPPATGGFGTFAFCGGTFAQLLTASKCPAATSVFFYNLPAGTFITWIPGSTVAAPNAAILALWPEQIPPGTIFTAKCL